ncbi:sialidase family protein [Jiangella endophytica]|uniref:sialidase family protein n=1 Tax=Jiangella endophytica TaxID=1623398 RepID=UPI000E342FBD|nr:sialidase family protein [Jiangella endophytica]
MTTHRSTRFRAALVAAVVSATALTSLQSAPASSGAATVDPFEDRTTVLFSSPNVPSGCYRIPAIVQAADGSLLAFAERRMHTCADKSHIRTVVRRLPPGTTEWLPEQTVVRGEAGDPQAPATRGNPGPAVYRRLPGAPPTDAPDGPIVLLGTQLDGADRLHGALDEFRVYDRALTGAELTRLRTRNANGIPGLTAHLPMNAVVPPAT